MHRIPTSNPSLSTSLSISVSVALFLRSNCALWTSKGICESATLRPEQKGLLPRPSPSVCASFRGKLRESETWGLEEPLPSFILPSKDQVQIPAPKGLQVVGQSWGLERRQAGTRLHIPGPKPRNPDSDSNQSLPGSYESVYVWVGGQIIILSSQSLTLQYRL